MLENFNEWTTIGCSIMSNGWTDKKRRSICNIFVNIVLKGQVFLYSLDNTEISKTAEKVFEMIDEVLDKVGEKKDRKSVV